MTLPRGLSLARCEELGTDRARKALEAMASEPWGRLPDAATVPGPGHGLLLALDWEGRAVGFLWWGPGADGGGACLPEVSSLCVRADWRGRGIASALVSEARGDLPEGFLANDDSALRGRRGDSFWTSPHPGAGWRAEGALPGNGSTRVRVAWNGS